VHPTQVTQWKATIRIGCRSCLNRAAARESGATDRAVAPKDRAADVDLDWLKKSPSSWSLTQLQGWSAPIRTLASASMRAIELCAALLLRAVPETEENLALMRRLDELHLEHPVYGSRKLTVLLRQAVWKSTASGVRLLR